MVGKKCIYMVLNNEGEWVCDEDGCPRKLENKCPLDYKKLEEGGKKMKLTVKERLLITRLYPQEGNIITQTLVRDIKKKIELTQTEITAINLKALSNGGLTWDEKTAKVKNVDFTKAELDLLTDGVDKLDKTNKVTQELLPLCIRIREE